MTYTLESRMLFFGEEQSKSYLEYDARVPQAKIVLWAKNSLQEQTCFAREGCGV